MSVSLKQRFAEWTKKAFMEVVQLEKFKRTLKAQQMIAMHDLGENREILTAERNAGEMDQTGPSAEREFAILGLNRRSELIRNIEGALRSIEDGTFGICTNCDEAIGRNRLAAVPWTLFCIRCQEVADRGDTRMMEPPYQLDFHAA